ncbi:MAG TPA: hypothetical protein VHA09_01230 [Nitrososphaera sp.]|nr:hypothetical protein [Nitrososphaera sp.]
MHDIKRRQIFYIDRPKQKEFTTLFNRAIEKGEQDRYYTLEYEVEEPERYFENAFLVNCNRFFVNMDFPDDIKTPTIYEVNLETEETKKTRLQPSTIVQNGRIKAKWSVKDVTPGRSFRFQWYNTQECITYRR